MMGSKKKNVLIESTSTVIQYHVHHDTTIMALREPVHIFSIPQNIIKTLSTRIGPQRSHPEPADVTPQPEVSDPSSSLSCALCLGAVFTSLSEQRNHFRSDWHRYNVKTRLQDANSKPVSESEFAELLEGEYTFMHWTR